ncbi:hypothetical protein M413DRAFT_25014 [Hebeloma cylindrosporum]|uniref:Uncharacterized protein n=1 Tax=Hebeloma cylindrosporum TaxID=76867 RepID=A0A0C3C6N4_HEBCY|nr:hypothetical protein M413DRAFT_25014 [Hebeloma cylindrosporum h7]
MDDDPWANAWGEPKSSLPDAALSPGWSAPSVSVLHGDNEDDLSTPSWPIKPTSQWNEPDVSGASLWNQDTSTLAWNPPPSTFDRISLPADPVQHESSFQIPLSPGFREFNAQSPTSPPTSIDPAITPPRTKAPDSPSPELSQTSTTVPFISIPSAEDIDGFGTFETAPDTAESVGWSPSRSALSLPSADGTAWGTTWEEEQFSGTTRESESEEVDDAWEIARQQKAKQDQHVPPELLATILRQLEGLTQDLWPDPSPPPEIERERVDFDDLGLNSVKLRLVPEDMVLPVNNPFEKTFTTKQLSEALRLTRHCPLTRSSPMALYMSSKGSTSWEASIIAKPIITQDDITPAGWKILDPIKEDPPIVDEGKKKASGGLLSFFGRRATNIPPEPVISSRSASPAIVPAVATIKANSSPRVSLDNIAVQSPATERSMPLPEVSAISAPSVQSLSDSNSNLGVVVSENDNEGPIPAPSAVSRFLGRFSSRSKPSVSRDSIPLSADDLEFLSDVPTIRSEAEQSPALDALSMMLKSPPLSTALPPPLAPPPKGPSRSFRHTPPAQDPQRPSNEFSFFDLDQGTANTTLAGPSLSLLTTAPIPPVKPPLGESAPTPNRNASPTHSFNLTPIPDYTQPPSDNEQSWPPFDYPSVSMNKPAPPQTKRSFVPIMSSSRTPSGTPPPLPKPGLPFALPPPPSSNHRPSSSNPAVGSSIAISPLPPPPSSRSHTPFRAQIQPPSTIIDEDDEFSDFLSSPSQTTHPAPLSFSNFGPAPSLTPIPSHPPPTISTNLFNDFNTSPLPPKPPAKTTPSPTRFSAPPLRPPSNPPPETMSGSKQSKVPRKADHSRTLSLLESAAARGRWLAPPSPLPEAIPPPDASNGKSSNVDLFGGNSTMQAQQAQAAATLANFASNSSNGNGNSQGWNFPPPSNTTSIIQPTLRRPPPPQPAFTSLPLPAVQPFPTKNGSTSSSAKTGGLSAQDLSFFEGL